MRRMTVSAGEPLEHQDNAIEVWVVQDVNDHSNIGGVYFCPFRALRYIQDWLQDIDQTIICHHPIQLHAGQETSCDYDIYVNQQLAYKLRRTYLRA